MHPRSQLRKGRNPDEDIVGSGNYPALIKATDEAPWQGPKRVSLAKPVDQGSNPGLCSLFAKNLLVVASGAPWWKTPSKTASLGEKRLGWGTPWWVCTDHKPGKSFTVTPKVAVKAAITVKATLIKWLRSARHRHGCP